MALKLGIQTYQILTNEDEVCIPSLSSILLDVNDTYTFGNKISMENSNIDSNHSIVDGVARPASILVTLP